MATTIRVALDSNIGVSRSYEIEIGRGNLRDIGRFIGQRRKFNHAVVITDENVRTLHAVTAQKSLAAAGILRSDLLSIPAGEASKCAAEAERLWNELARLKADRKSIVV